MGITIYGTILIIYITAICIKIKDNKSRFIELFILGVFLYLNISIGYVIKIGQQTIAGYFIAMLISGMLAANSLKNMSKKRLVIVAIFLVNIVLSMALILFKDYLIVDANGWDYFLFGANNTTKCTITGTQIKELIKSFAFILVVEMVHRCLSERDWHYIISKVVKGSKFVLCYGIFEFVAVYIFKITNIYILFLKPIFGQKASTYTVSLSRGGGYQLQGLFTEPAAYATGLFYLVLLFWTYMKNGKSTMPSNNLCKKECYIWIFIALFLMIASMSFSSVLYLGLLTGMWLLYTYKTHTKDRLIILGSVLLIVVIVGGFLFILMSSGSYYGERLSAALYIFKTALVDPDLGNLYFHVLEKAPDGSTISRLGSAIGILKMEFIQNPLLGLGLGTGNAYAEIPNMLTDMGIIGSICWMNVVALNSRKDNIYIYIAFIGVACAALISTPFTYLGADVIILVYMIETLYGSCPGKKRHR